MNRLDFPAMFPPKLCNGGNLHQAKLSPHPQPPTFTSLSSPILQHPKQRSISHRHHHALQRLRGAILAHLHDLRPGCSNFLPHASAPFGFGITATRPARTSIAIGVPKIPTIGTHLDDPAPEGGACRTTSHII